MNPITDQYRGAMRLMVAFAILCGFAFVVDRFVDVLKPKYELPMLFGVAFFAFMYFAYQGDMKDREAEE